MLRPSASRRIFGTSPSRAPSPVPPSTSGAPPGRRAAAIDGDLRVGAHDQHIGVVAKLDDEPSQVNLRAIELHGGIGAEQPDHRDVAAEHAEGGAVLGRGAVEKVGRPQAAGARHVLHRDRRIARNEAPEVPRQQPRREVVAAARPVADDQVDLPALVEGFDRVLSPHRAGRHDGEQDRGREPHSATAPVDRHERAVAIATGHGVRPRDCRTFRGSGVASRCAAAA